MLKITLKSGMTAEKVMQQIEPDEIILHEVHELLNEVTDGNSARAWYERSVYGDEILATHAFQTEDDFDEYEWPDKLDDEETFGMYFPAEWCQDKLKDVLKWKNTRDRILKDTNWALYSALVDEIHEALWGEIE